VTSTPPGGEDPLEEAAQDLRRRVGGEFRAQREVAEAEADQLARRRSTLVDAARLAAHRGDRVEVRVADRTFNGEVAAAGPDHLWLRVDAGSLHVALTALRSLRVVSRSGAGHSADDPGSLRAMLRTCEMDGRPVTLIVQDGLDVEGVVRTCAADHLVMADDDGEVIVPLGQVAAVLDRSGSP
jgi:hypothetical protein